MVKYGSIEDLEPDDIKSINVLKGEAALKKYGEKANNGVVEVELNPGATTPEKDLQLISNDSKEKPLVVINGNIVKHGSVEDLEPDDIATINVVKGAAAKTKYGDKGANGVVEVIMKVGKTYQPNELDTLVIFNPDTFEEQVFVINRIVDQIPVFDPPGDNASLSEIFESLYGDYNWSSTTVGCLVDDEGSVKMMSLDHQFDPNILNAQQLNELDAFLRNSWMKNDLKIFNPATKDGKAVSFNYEFTVNKK